MLTIVYKKLFRFAITPSLIGISAAFCVVANAWAVDQAEISLSLGQIYGSLDNQQGGLVTNRYYGTSYVNANAYQLQLRSRLNVSDLKLSASAGNTQYQLRIVDSLSSLRTVARDSIYSSASQREFYSESDSQADYMQWDFLIVTLYRGYNFGFGLKNMILTVHNYDGVESYDQVPGFYTPQAGTVVDYSSSYKLPYLCAQLPYNVNNLSLKLQLNWLPKISANETEIHHWRGYRTDTHLTGDGFDLVLNARMQLDKKTFLNFNYENSLYSLKGRSRFENSDTLSMDEAQAFHQWQVLIGLAFLI